MLLPPIGRAPQRGDLDRPRTPRRDLDDRRVEYDVELAGAGDLLHEPVEPAREADRDRPRGADLGEQRGRHARDDEVPVLWIGGQDRLGHLRDMPGEVAVGGDHRLDGLAGPAHVGVEEHARQDLADERRMARPERLPRLAGDPVEGQAVEARPRPIPDRPLDQAPCLHQLIDDLLGAHRLEQRDEVGRERDPDPPGS